MCVFCSFGPVGTVLVPCTSFLTVSNSANISLLFVLFVLFGFCLTGHPGLHRGNHRVCVVLDVPNPLAIVPGALAVAAFAYRSLQQPVESHTLSGIAFLLIILAGGCSRVERLPNMLALHGFDARPIPLDLGFLAVLGQGVVETPS
jgi:hypothetical protein